MLLVRDRYDAIGGALKIARRTVVERAAADDLGFQTKISLYQAQSDDLRAFDYFSPGQWYRQNEFAADYAPGKNMDLQYYWRKETYSGLPLFAMRAKETGRGRRVFPLGGGRGRCPRSTARPPKTTPMWTRR